MYKFLFEFCIFLREANCEKELNSIYERIKDPNEQNDFKHVLNEFGLRNALNSIGRFILRLRAGSDTSQTMSNIVVNVGSGTVNTINPGPLRRPIHASPRVHPYLRAGGSQELRGPAIKRINIENLNAVSFGYLKYLSKDNENSPNDNQLNYVSDDYLKYLQKQSEEREKALKDQQKSSKSE